MKKAIILFIALSLMVLSMPSYAAKDQRGASPRAYQQASDEAIFHRVGDWFAARGKTENEKKAIIAQRKAERIAKRAQKEAEKRKREAEREMKKAQKEMQNKLKKK